MRKEVKGVRKATGEKNGKNETLELLGKIRTNDDSSFEKLAEIYRPLLVSVAASFDATAKEEGLGSVFADLMQELSLALYRAAMTFDVSQDKVTFGNYAKRCLNNCAISALRKSRSAARRETKVKDSLKKEHGHGPFASESTDRAVSLDDAKNILSRYEYEIFSKYVDGESVADIAAELGRSAKSVSNALFRCKSKLKAYLPRQRT